VVLEDLTFNLGTKRSTERESFRNLAAGLALVVEETTEKCNKENMKDEHWIRAEIFNNAEQ